MKRQNLKNILMATSAFLAVIAFFWVVGTAGALEHDNITCLQFVVQSLLAAPIGLLAWGCGALSDAL